MGCQSSKTIKLSSFEMTELRQKYRRTPVSHQTLGQVNQERARLESATLELLLPRLIEQLDPLVRNNQLLRLVIQYRYHSADQANIDFLLTKKLVETYESKQGRVLTLSQTSADPDFKVILSLHGQQTVSYQLVITDQTITDFKNQTSIRHATIDALINMPLADQSPIYQTLVNPSFRELKLNCSRPNCQHKPVGYYKQTGEIICDGHPCKCYQSFTPVESRIYAIQLAGRLPLKIHHEEHCPICLERKPTGYFQNCRHVLCRECYDSYSEETCPICRDPISEFLSVPSTFPKTTDRVAHRRLRKNKPTQIL